MPNKENNIDEIIDGTFKHIKDIVDANTIIGKTIRLSDNMYIIPVSKVSVGLISGGGVFPKGKSSNMGTSTGFNIVPVGFVSISESIVSFLPVNNIDSTTKNIIDNLFKLSEKIIEKNEVLSDERTEE